ncbi:MAG: hypothetical protein WC796_03620 [Candidatus Pacearchaeota archaeon]|jgi:polyferredoxin
MTKQLKLNFGQKLELFRQKHQVAFYILLIIIGFLSWGQMFQIFGDFEPFQINLLNLVRGLFFAVFYFTLVYLFSETWFEYQKIRSKNISNDSLLKLMNY